MLKKDLKVHLKHARLVYVHQILFRQIVLKFDHDSEWSHDVKYDGDSSL